MNPSQTIGEDQSMILINELERSLKVTLFGTKPKEMGEKIANNERTDDVMEDEEIDLSDVECEDADSSDTNSNE